MTNRYANLDLAKYRADPKGHLLLAICAETGFPEDQVRNWLDHPRHELLQKELHAQARDQSTLELLVGQTIKWVKDDHSLKQDGFENAS